MDTGPADARPEGERPAGARNLGDFGEVDDLAGGDLDVVVSCAKQVLELIKRLAGMLGLSSLLLSGTPAGIHQVPLD